MKMNLRFLFILLLPCLSFAQVKENPFAGEIRQFARADSIQMPPKNAILFVGSSSFRMWKGIQDSFPSHAIINRGFGGSTLLDVIHFKNETIYKYQPKQIFIYCGENDIASSDSITPEMVLERFRILFRDTRKNLPQVPIAFVSMKPSPSRWHMKDRLIKGNELIKAWLQKQKNVVYIDVWESMLDAEGKPRQELFIKDNLHMNEKGYELWETLIRPFLIQ
jgi:lysophospholipase L1-like esterase